MKKLITLVVFLVLLFTTQVGAGLDSVAKRKAAQTPSFVPTPPKPDKVISVADRATLIGVYGAFDTVTVTFFSGVRSSRYVVLSKFTAVVTTNDVNSVSQAIAPIYGVAERVVIDTTGTDTNFTVTLKDENDVTFFTKTDCSSANTPFSYAIHEVGTDDTSHRGVSISGAMAVYVADANGLSDLSVIVYYREETR